MPNRILRTLSLAVPCLLLASAAARATDFYVSPSGNGDGSIGNPWSLDTALDQPSAVHPGDTIWLRGGTYTGTHTSNLSGTSGSPIIVRQYPGERATLDGGSAGQTKTTLSVSGQYTWFWGFEIMSSDTRRSSNQSGSSPSDIYRPDAIQIVQNSGTGSGLKFINLVIHDARQGISYWKEAVDSEINGCLIYYNGWQGPDRGHGHGIYTQNQTGTKKMIDNIIFDQFGGGIQAYGSETSYLNNFWVEGNTSFENGSISTLDASDNILIGGGSVTKNDTIINNAVYYDSHGDRPTSAFHIGYTGGCSNATIKDNYVAANSDLSNCAPSTMTGNTFIGTIDGFSSNQYPSNTYLPSSPGTAKVILRPNAYEAGRANITVFNWAGDSAMGVDLSSVLTNGQGFEIRNGMDFFGAPVVSGTYSGGAVTIPMTALSVASPVGWGAPASLGPQFGVFVVLPASGGGSPPPTGLPGPWQQGDIGAVGGAGSSSSTSGNYTVSGSGADIWDSSDEFHFVYQPLSGDGTIVARVNSIDYTNEWAKAGVMIRESLAANSTHAMTVITAGNGVAFQRRESTGGSSLDTHVPGPSAPYWVKLVRAGNTFTGYGSSDGVNWSSIGSDTVAMAANVYVGLAVTSHNDGAICNASMDNVAISNGSQTILRIGGETGVLTSPMAIFSDGGAFGGQYIATTTSNSGSASWTFSVPSSGTYFVWGRVKTPNPQQDSFYVKMDSGSEDVYDAAAFSGWGSGWKWTVLNGRGSSGVSMSINPRTFSLSAGSHTLTFRARESQTGLDRIIITNDPSFVPTESP